MPNLVIVASLRDCPGVLLAAPVAWLTLRRIKQQSTVTGNCRRYQTAMVQAGLKPLECGTVSSRTSCGVLPPGMGFRYGYESFAFPTFSSVRFVLTHLTVEI